MKSILLVSLSLIMILTACGGGETATEQLSGQVQIASVTPATVTTDETVATPVPVDNGTDTSLAPQQTVAVVAIVNNEEIGREAFERELSRRRKYSIDPNEQTLVAMTLDAMIEQVVINQAASGLGVNVNDADIQAEIDILRTQSGSEQAWQQWLNDNEYTQEEFYQAIRNQLITSRVREVVTTNPSAEVIPQVRARHILVSDEATAREILNRLNNGETFEALAREYSRDVQTRDNGGDLGFFYADLLTVPELAQVAFSLQVNEISEPIQTILGYHIVQTLEFADRPAQEFDTGLQTEARFIEWLQTQRAAARIERLLE